jgi:hypothetical protein
MGRMGGGVDRVKNRSGKWEGGGVDGVKIRSGKCEGPGGGGGGLTGYITHLCIMHGATIVYSKGRMKLPLKPDGQWHAAVIHMSSMASPIDWPRCQYVMSSFVLIVCGRLGGHPAPACTRAHSHCTKGAAAALASSCAADASSLRNPSGPSAPSFRKIACACSSSMITRWLDAAASAPSLVSTTPQARLGPTYLNVVSLSGP